MQLQLTNLRDSADDENRSFQILQCTNPFSASNLKQHNKQSESLKYDKNNFDELDKLNNLEDSQFKTTNSIVNSPGIIQPKLEEKFSLSKKDDRIPVGQKNK